MPIGSTGRVVAALAAGTAIVIAVLMDERAAAQTSTLDVSPSRLPRLGTVDERYQSYNVEMVEVTGGEFWKPHAANASSNLDGIGTGRDPDLFFI